MSKLLRNTTASDIFVSDVGINIPASSTYISQTTDALLWAGSDELITHLGSGDLVGNDGTIDLTPAEAVKLFQGLYPKEVGLIGVSSTNGALDVNATVTTNPSDLMLEIPKGNILGHGQMNKFGHNDSLSSSNFEDIWGGGGDYPFSINAEKVNIVSDSTLDISTGTGARKITLYGLDSNYTEISETINLNGKSNVLSVNSYLRLQRAVIIDAGSLDFNQGTITATQETSNDKLISMVPNTNQTLIAQWTVPAGKTAYIMEWFFTLKSGKSTDVRMYIRKYGEVFQCKRSLVIDSSSNQTWNPYLKVTEKSDIRISAKASTGSHEVSSGYNIILVDN